MSLFLLLLLHTTASYSFQQRRTLHFDEPSYCLFALYNGKRVKHTQRRRINLVAKVSLFFPWRQLDNAWNSQTNRVMAKKRNRSRSRRRKAGLSATTFRVADTFSRQGCCRAPTFRSWFPRLRRRNANKSTAYTPAAIDGCLLCKVNTSNSWHPTEQSHLRRLISTKRTFENEAAHQLGRSAIQAKGEWRACRTN